VFNAKSERSNVTGLLFVVSTVQAAALTSLSAGMPVGTGYSD
jgi:hypothetical protein